MSERTKKPNGEDIRKILKEGKATPQASEGARRRSWGRRDGKKEGMYCS